jgi:hypothetical protein
MIHNQILGWIMDIYQEGLVEKLLQTGLENFLYIFSEDSANSVPSSKK